MILKRIGDNPDILNWNERGELKYKGIQTCIGNSLKKRKYGKDTRYLQKPSIKEIKISEKFEIQTKLWISPLLIHNLVWISKIGFQRANEAFPMMILHEFTLPEHFPWLNFVFLSFFF